jgi:CRISPR-associated protein Cas2
MEQTWIVTYDIADRRRLARVAKILEEHGLRLQRSVFECLLAPKDLKRLRRRLEQEMEPDEDGLKFFPLCKRCEQRVTVYGDAAEPERQYERVVIV